MSQTETALAAAMKRAGGRSEVEIQVDIAHARFRNNGGTLQQLLMRCYLAYGMPDEGQFDVASDGQSMNANAGQPQGRSDGHTIVASNGQLMPADHLPTKGSAAGQFKSASNGRMNDARPLPPQANGSGRLRSASHGHRQHAAPVREPSAADRAAARKVQTAAAVSVMDTFKIDGRAIGDWTVDDALRAGKEKTYQGRILLSVARHVANPQPGDRIRNVVSVSSIQKIIQQAAETADAA